VSSVPRLPIKQKPWVITPGLLRSLVATIQSVNIDLLLRLSEVKYYFRVMPFTNPNAWTSNTPWCKV
jgi:hypothetical protein